ncbi:MAG: phenylalanine--tRNA ligase subunit beta, partial [bacterium]
AAGQKVIVALVGAILPGDFNIKKSIIRGVESHGMICSLDELGIDHKYHQEDGIHVLPVEAIPGSDPLVVLGFDDVVIDLDLTPNRADLLSMMGVAYDVGAMLSAPVRFQNPQVLEDEETNPITVAAQTSECRSYYARVIKDVVIAESPEWLKARLIAAGIRPINNIVDITNYVMLETGQPLHAFDYDKIGTDQIIVRSAGDDHRFTTLDGKERLLTSEDLVITNGVQPIALAGVMGGQATEVDAGTTAILLESAVFDNIRVRKTSKRLDLRSESSLRFERGLDPNRTRLACDRAAELFKLLASGRILQGVAIYESQKMEPLPVSLAVAKINSVTGYHYDTPLLADVWKRLGFDFTCENDIFTVMVPTRRQDLLTYQDLIEEAVRISGYQLIPTTLHAAIFNGYLTDIQKKRRLVRQTLLSLGLDEVIGYSLVTSAMAVDFDVAPLAEVRLLHPMTEDRSVLRHSLVPSLLAILDYNLKRKAEDIALFEIGKGYTLTAEIEYVAGVLTGNWQDSPWQDKTDPIDFFVVKGVLEALFAALGIKNTSYVKPLKERHLLHPGIAAEIVVADEKIGIVGKLHPNVAADRGLPDVFVFEIRLEGLLAAMKKGGLMQEVPKYPSVKRDIAVVVDASIPAGAVIAVLKKAGKKTLVDVSVFDLYVDDSLGQGKKSLALSLTFQDTEKTLETDEIDRAVAGLLKALARETGAVLRS